MIYIKTDMKELPKGCEECHFLGDYDTGRYCEGVGTNQHYDKIIDDYIFGDIEYVPGCRPSWCPLVEREDIK